MRSYLRPVLALLSVLVFCQPLAHAQEGLPSTDIKYKRFEVNWTVRTASEAVVEVLSEREALSANGAQMLTKVSMGFNESLEQAEFLEVYTLKKDGTRIDAGKDAYVSQSGLAQGGSAASMPEWQVRQVTLPNVSPGDRVVDRVRRVVKKPMLEGWQSLEGYLWPSVDYESVQWRITAPRNVPLSLKATGLDVQRSERADVQEWTLKGSARGRSLDGNPANTRTSNIGRFQASTVADMREVGRLYAQAAADKAAPNEELKKIAAEATRGLTKTNEQTKALYDWVRKNIRYVAVYLGAGGFVPHDLAWILKNRYGDCKDHVLLLQALLAEKGIQSQPALVNTNSEYLMDDLPTASSFNHVVLYVGELDLYLDPTATQTRYGLLPWVIYGKPVVLADVQNPVVRRVPTMRAEDHRTHVKSSWKIAADGSANGKIDVSATGLAAYSLQQRLQQIPTGMGADAVRRLLESSGLQGEGSASFERVDFDRGTQTVSFVVSAKDLLKTPDGGAMPPHPQINMPVYISSGRGAYTALKREFDFSCSASKTTEEFTLEFDPLYQLVRIPKDAKFKYGGIEFEGQYSKEGYVVRGKRVYTGQPANGYCTAKDYAAWQETAAQLTRHLRSTIVYMQ
jgi:Domain of Unknown Function with PDB structure (DUF3857)/Transglutaminase-like superfamily